MSSMLIEEADVPAAEPADPGLLDGCAWMAAITFALGGTPLAFMLVAREAGPYGAGLLAVLPLVAFGIGGIGVVAALSILDRVWHRSRPVLRTVAATGALVAATVCLGSIIDGYQAPRLSEEKTGVAIAGICLFVLAAVLAARRSERSGALAFASAWLLLLAVVSYSVWTEMEVEVAWLGPNSIDDSPGQFAFTATRSGEFVVRFGARSCSDGRVIATGHYTHRPDRGSNFGPPMVVELPLDVLPLQDGDLVRACVRDGFAAATRAGEVSMAPSFWERD